MQHALFSNRKIGQVFEHILMLFEYCDKKNRQGFTLGSFC